MKLKTKLYSKKQIQEAISFWTRILENTSPLIDALIEDFGYDVVFSRKKIVPTLKNVNELYDIINRHLFNDKLNKCPIEDDHLNFCKNIGAEMGYNHFLYEDPSNPGTYTLLTQFGQDLAGNIYTPPAIYVSNELLNSHIPLIALVSIVAHEMIHQYITEFGEGRQRSYDEDKKHIPYDEHSGEFEKWMNLANTKFGLYVTPKGSKKTYSKDATNALRKLVGNDYKRLSEKEESIEQYRKITKYETGLVHITYC